MSAVNSASGDAVEDQMDTTLYDDLLDQLRRPPQWTPQQEQTLLEPYEYLTSMPGKELRPMLIDAFNAWLQVPTASLDAVKRIVQMLHNASLLVDDVEDASDLRRGIPVAHKIYGVPQAINAANYVYFLAYEELNHLSPPSGGSSRDLWQLVNEELLHLHRGQGLDLHWRDSLTCPTEEEYIAMVNNKTGGLFRIAVKLMTAMSPLPNPADYVPLANLISVIFQIRDDYMNLQSSQYAENKGFCEDLTEGKFSFPIVHSIRADTSNQRLLNILRQRTTNVHTKSYAVTYLRDHTRSFAYTLAVLAKLDGQARAEIKRLGGNDLLEAIVERMRVVDEGPAASQVV